MITVVVWMGYFWMVRSKVEQERREEVTRGMLVMNDEPSRIHSINVSIYNNMQIEMEKERTSITFQPPVNSLSSSSSERVTTAA